MYRFKSVLNYSKLDQSLSAFVKKYKTNQKQQVKSSNKMIEADTTKNIDISAQQQQSTDDSLKQKYLLSKAKQVDLFDKDRFSHYNRAQQLVLDKQIKITKEQYKREAEAYKSNIEGELLVDDSKLPQEFLRGLDQARIEGKQWLSDSFVFHRQPFTEKFKFKDFKDWKKYNKLRKPNNDQLVMEELKPYPGTEKGPLPILDPEGFTKWFNENHSQKTIEAAEKLAKYAYRFPLEVTDPDKARMLQAQRRNKNQNSQPDEIPFPEPSENKESKWVMVSAGPAAFVQETMIEMMLKGDPFEDIESQEFVRLQNYIPDDEIQPLPEKHPLMKTELIYYLERWSFFRSLQAFELLKKITDGDIEKKECEPTKTASLNTYYQLLPKYLRDDPNVKNVYRGLEFGNNQMSLEAKEKALNLAAKLSCPFDEFNNEVFEVGSSGYNEHVSRFDEERLIQDQENDHVDAAIAPDTTFKYMEQRKHTPRHVAKDDLPLPDFAIDKKERIDDLPVDYYINDDGFWNEYIQAKEHKHLRDSPISAGKQFFKHN